MAASFTTKLDAKAEAWILWSSEQLQMKVAMRSGPSTGYALVSDSVDVSHEAGSLAEAVLLHKSMLPSLFRLLGLPKHLQRAARCWSCSSSIG